MTSDINEMLQSALEAGLLEHIRTGKLTSADMEALRYLGMILTEWARYSEVGFNFSKETASMVNQIVQQMVDSGNLLILLNLVKRHVHPSEQSKVAAKVMESAGISKDVARHLSLEREKILAEFVKKAVESATPEMPAHVVMGTLAPQLMLRAERLAGVADLEAALMAEDALLKLHTEAKDAIQNNGGKIAQTEVVHMLAVTAQIIDVTKERDRRKLEEIARMYESLNTHRGTQFRLAVVGDVSPELEKFLKERGINFIKDLGESARGTLENTLNPQRLPSTLTAVLSGREGEAFLDKFAEEVEHIIRLDNMGMFGAATASFIKHRVVPGGEFGCTDFTDAGIKELRNMTRRQTMRRDQHHPVAIEEEREEQRSAMDDYILSDMEADVAF